MNTKRIATYAGVLATLVIIVLLLNFYRTGNILPTHILPVTSASTTSTTSVRTTSSLLTTTVHNSYSSCIPSTPTNISIFNGNFGTGTYEGWNITGKAFGSAPLNLTYMNAQHNYYGTPWSGYNGTFVASTFQGFISGDGNITSEPFKVVEPYLNFQIISAENQGLYIEVLSGNVVFEKAYFDTFNQSITKNYQTTYLNGSINIAPLLCKNASVRIVSGLQASISSRYSYISAGNFYISPTPVITPGILLNTTFPNGS